MPTTISTATPTIEGRFFASGERMATLSAFSMMTGLWVMGKRHSHLRSRMELISSCPTKNNPDPDTRLKTVVAQVGERNDHYNEKMVNVRFGVSIHAFAVNTSGLLMLRLWLG